jgi:catechol 2,3-dioxygenase-like lactoylglutathione lyase family enzyme
VSKVFSPRTLEAFEAASASIPLRPLDRAFEGAGLRLGKDPGGPEGARRTQFRRYVAGVDQRNSQQLQRLCAALGTLIDEVAESKQDFLVKAAERDGFFYANGAFSVKKPSAAGIGASVILASEPQIFVSDIGIASAFYVDKLGFKILLSYGEPAFFVQIARGGGRLNMRRVSGPVFDSGFRARQVDALSATFTLDDAKPLYREFEKAGVAFHQTLRTEPWGARTFIVQDPDGNLIAFAGS